MIWKCDECGGFTGELDEVTAHLEKVHEFSREDAELFSSPADENSPEAKEWARRVIEEAQAAPPKNPGLALKRKPGF